MCQCLERRCPEISIQVSLHIIAKQTNKKIAGRQSDIKIICG
jgi:hypothetical protein